MSPAAHSTQASAHAGPVGLPGDGGAGERGSARVYLRELWRLQCILAGRNLPWASRFKRKLYRVDQNYGPTLGL